MGGSNPDRAIPTLSPKKNETPMLFYLAKVKERHGEGFQTLRPYSFGGSQVERIIKLVLTTLASSIRFDKSGFKSNN